MKLSNKKIAPFYNEGSKILFVVPFPTEVDEDAGQLLSGKEGIKLLELLDSYEVPRNNYSIIAACPYRPYNNTLSYIKDTEQEKEGQYDLIMFIEKLQPNIICAMGHEVLDFLTDKLPLSRHRGSIYQAKISNTKVIGTYSPLHVMRSPDLYPIWAWDIKRVTEEAASPELKRKERLYYIEPTQEQTEELLLKLQLTTHVACDIEAVKNSRKILCHGFSPDGIHSYVYPHEPQYYDIINRLYATDTNKIFHYGVYDYNMLTDNGIEVRNYTEDTFFQFHLVQPELPRSLDFLTSIYTKEPYYKQEGRAEIPEDTKVWGEKQDRNKLYIYNAKDCAVTYEIWEYLDKYLKENELYDLYRFHMEANLVAIDIGRNGMLVDIETNLKIKMALTQKWYKLQAILNTLSTKPVNVNSPKRVKSFLYNELELPERKQRNTKGEWVVSVGEDTIVSLIAYCKDKLSKLKTPKAQATWEMRKTALSLILEIRGLRKLISGYLSLKLSSEQRAQSIFIAHAGTDTARWSCSMFLEKEGVNAQTFPREAITIPDDFDPNFDVFKWINLIETEKIEEDV